MSWPAARLTCWRRGCAATPASQVVCRDGSGAYGEAVRRALPGAVQAGDRWHLWHSLAEAVLKEVAAHSSCWAAAGPPLNEGRQAADHSRAVAAGPRPDRQGHRAAGMLTPARPVTEHGQALRPRRRARADDPRAPVPGHHWWTPTVITCAPAAPPTPPCPSAAARRDPRAGLPRQHEPALPLHHPGPGRSRPAAPVTPARHPAPAHPARRPQRQPAGAARRADRRLPRDDQPRRPGPLLRRPAPARPRATRPGSRTGPRPPGPATCPHLHAFTRGLDLDTQAVIAAVTLPFHNGRTEGVNTKTKMIKRQMYGRAGFTLLRHRILLG